MPSQIPSKTNCCDIAIGPYRPLILGSNSPRRRELMQTMGIGFRVVTGGQEDRARQTEHPHQYLERVVNQKLQAVAKVLSSPLNEPFAGVLVADTVVVLDDVILGKPHDVEEARQMLRELCGRCHQVLTRFAISYHWSPQRACFAQTVRTLVWFRKLNEQQLCAYADSGEGLDKAGAYAIQGLGGFAVERIEGSYHNVVGLPVCEVVQALLHTGLLDRFPL